jgi:alkylhydroperoxidase/carboxymuconolactone decarboxylase family protein YurZ
MPPKSFEESMAVRRKVLGDDYVDAAEKNKVAFDEPYQAMITDAAWGHVWSRDDISLRERSMIVLGILASTGRWEEFELHIRRKISARSCSMSRSMAACRQPIRPSASQRKHSPKWGRFRRLQARVLRIQVDSGSGLEAVWRQPSQAYYYNPLA